MGTDPEQRESGTRLHFSVGTGFEFLGKTGSGFGMYDMVYIECNVYVCK